MVLGVAAARLNDGALLVAAVEPDAFDESTPFISFDTLCRKSLRKLFALSELEGVFESVGFADGGAAFAEAEPPDGAGEAEGTSAAAGS
jgi:hypothetical protein